MCAFARVQARVYTQSPGSVRLRARLIAPVLPHVSPQGIFAHDSPFLQLPHLTEKEARLLSKKGLNTMDRFRRAPEDKKQVGCRLCRLCRSLLAVCASCLA